MLAILHNLPVLLIHIDEVALKSKVHLLSHLAILRLVVQSQKHLEEDHLEGVLAKEQIVCRLFLHQVAGFGDLVGGEQFDQKPEESVPFLLVEGIDDETLPQNVDVLYLEQFRGAVLVQGLEEVESSFQFLQIVEIEALVGDQVLQEGSV